MARDYRQTLLFGDVAAVAGGLEVDGNGKLVVLAGDCVREGGIGVQCWVQSWTDGVMIGEWGVGVTEQ